MKARYTYHNNGDISIRLMPEDTAESQAMHSIMSSPPGGCPVDPDDKCRARIDAPLIHAGGTTWGELGVGDATLRDGICTRRIAVGWVD